ncbi:beta-lactamase/transpeptidase-like protein [Thozetella sp. PMI_491]|nr:beta-lactamase/transpeptidase-like protein [Thozetella sp. PMI_491]
MDFTPFTPDFDRAVEGQLGRWHIPGVAFSVVHEECTWTKGYGLADFESKAPVDPSNTLFFGASTTKAHLCAAWAIYIASDANQSKPLDERITWRTPMVKIIPGDFILSDPVRTPQVTLEDCLSHRTGLPRHEMSTARGGDNVLQQITRNLRNLPLHNSLREEHEYCNQGFIASSYALEVTTGKPLSTYIKEALWYPLDMRDTYGGFREAHAAGGSIAQGHSWTKLPSDSDWDDVELTKESPLDGAERAGAGFIASTADDYAKWMRALLNPSSSGPITEDIVKSVWAPRVVLPPTDAANIPFEGVIAYALGWYMSSYKTHLVYFHAGEIDGYGAFVMIVPSLKLGVSLLSNGQRAHNVLKGLSVGLIDALLGDSGDKALETVEEAFLKSNKDQAEKASTALQRLYPDAPATPTIPLALDVKEYTGSYRNLAYGPFTLELLDRGKDAGSTQFESTTYLVSRTGQHHSLPRTSTFTYINAENWFVTRFETGIEVVNPDRSPSKTALKAQTRINAKGQVEAIGITMEPALPDLFFWFTKES